MPANHWLPLVAIGVQSHHLITAIGGKRSYSSLATALASALESSESKMGLQGAVFLGNLTARAWPWRKSNATVAPVKTAKRGNQFDCYRPL